MALPPLLRLRTTRLCAALYLIISLLCTQVPLLNYLGYEFSALIALFGSFVSAFLTIGLLERARGSGGSPWGERNAGIAIYLDSLLVCLTLLIIPFAVLMTNALFVKNCSLIEGIGFFLLLPVSSVIFSSSLAFFCVVLWHRARLAFTLMFLLTIAYAIGLGYFTPAIYSYNFFYGYFPGVTYDEALGISAALLLFRILTLLIAAVLLECALLVMGTTRATDTSRVKIISLAKVLTMRPRIYSTMLVGVILMCAFLYRNELGFESHRSFILMTLNKEWRTEHFTIHFAQGSYSEEEARWIAAEHEFQFDQILSVLPVDFQGTIESFIYPSNEIKRRLIGAGATNFAKPWSRQIHITKQSLNSTLKHELVHVLAAPFGVPVIRASWSTGLVEGLATAIVQVSGNRTLHEDAAALYRFGLAPPVEQMMSFTGFASQQSAVSYVLAGSFCRFLIDRYGVRKMMLVYRSSDYTSVYGRSLIELITEWKGFLTRISVTDHDRDAIDVFFRRPPIFLKVCARVLARTMQEAGKKFNEKDYGTALILYRAAFEEGRSYEGLNGYLASALRLREFQALSSALDTIILRDPVPGRYLPLFVNIGDALWAEGRARQAAEVYSRLATADIANGLTEAATLRLFSVQWQAGGRPLLSYYLSDASDTLRLGILDSMIQKAPGGWIPLYLKAKVLQRLKKDRELLDAVRSFSLADTDAHLEAFRLRLEGYALFRLKRFQDAKVPFWTSLNFDGTEAAKDEMKEWVERCDWLSTHPIL